MATCAESFMCELCGPPTFADVRHRGTWLCYAHRAETIANDHAAHLRQEEVSHACSIRREESIPAE